MIQSNINRINAEGNGAGSVFSLSPMVLLENDTISVVTVDTDGVETTRTEGTGATNYSLSVPSYPGTGSITFPASGSAYLDTGEYIVVTRETPITQEVRLENQGGYFPAVQEGVFDKLTVICQNLQQQIDRCLKISVGDVGQTPDEVYGALSISSAAAVAAAEEATAAAEAAALFDPALYVAKAGATMTGDLLIDNASSPVSKKLLFVHENDTDTRLYRGTGGGNWYLDHATAPGTSAAISFNPKPGSAAGEAYVNLFETTNTTGGKTIRIYRGDGSSNVSGTLVVPASKDGIEATGRFVTEGGYDAPFVVDTIRIWEDSGVLRWKDGSDPSSVSDGNMISPFSRQYVSPSDLTITSRTETFTESHGLGAQPTMARAVLICQSDELGYSAGDAVHISDSTATSSSTNGFGVWTSASEVGVSMRLMEIHNKTTGVVTAITPARWKLRLYAWR